MSCGLWIIITQFHNNSRSSIIWEFRVANYYPFARLTIDTSVLILIERISVVLYNDRKCSQLFDLSKEGSPHISVGYKTGYHNDWSKHVLSPLPRSAVWYIALGREKNPMDHWQCSGFMYFKEASVQKRIYIYIYIYWESYQNWQQV